jgi:hypothetical protein
MNIGTEDSSFVDDGVRMKIDKVVDTYVDHQPVDSKKTEALLQPRRDPPFKFNVDGSFLIKRNWAATEGTVSELVSALQDWSNQSNANLTVNEEPDGISLRTWNEWSSDKTSEPTEDSASDSQMETSRATSRNKVSFKDPEYLTREFDRLKFPLTGNLNSSSMGIIPPSLLRPTSASYSQDSGLSTQWGISTPDAGTIPDIYITGVTVQRFRGVQTCVLKLTADEVTAFAKWLDTEIQGHIPVDPPTVAANIIKFRRQPNFKILWNIQHAYDTDKEY